MMSNSSSPEKPKNRKRSQKALDKYREVLKAGGVVLCGICGGQIHWPETPVLGPLTIDHILPRNLGGTSRQTNLQPAHKKCNSHKNHDPEYKPTVVHAGRIKRALKLTGISKYQERKSVT